MSSGRHIAALLGTLLSALLLAGCSGAPSVPSGPHVDVDTASLRAAKQAAGIAPCPATDAAAAAEGLPQASLPCFGGGRDVDLAGLRGPMVINLWAQWCGPCRRELPIYQRFSQAYDGKVAVLGVDWNDTQPDLAMRLVRKSGVTYPLVADPEPALRGNVLPRIIMIDRDGSIAWQGALEIKSLQELQDLVAKHLGVSL